MLLWTLGPPRIRFLLASFGVWGVVMATIVAQGLESRRSLHRQVARLIMGGSVVLLFLTVILVVGKRQLFFQPWKVAFGLEGRSDYLHRTWLSYEGWEYVQAHLGPNDRVLLIGDARHYYCPLQCYPEADQFTWPRIVWAERENVEAVAHRLKAMGVTHLWVSLSDIAWLLDHDPNGWMQRSYDFLVRFVSQCAERIYVSEAVMIFRLTCQEY